MKEIIPRISDDTYDTLQTLNEETIYNAVALQQAMDMNPWLKDLLISCRQAVQRNEILKHNKSTARVREQRWLEQDCERYGTTVEKFLQKFPHATSVRGSEDISEVPGIPINDPEYDYYKEKLNET